MKQFEIAKIKAELLCYGVRLDAIVEEKGKIKNSYLLDGGFVHAAHFLIDNIIVNTCVNEEFCKVSPYEIVWDNGRTILKKEDIFVCDIEILSLPDWCLNKIDDYIIGDYLRPHSPNCISCCPKLKCTYYTDNQQCKFCSLAFCANNNNLDTILPVSTVAEMVKTALRYNHNYEIALSGGTCSSEDKSAIYFSDICNLITNNGKDKHNISIELAPPDKDLYIELLLKAGASSLIMNIEVVDEKLRKKICPGKSNISLNRYFEAFEKAVSVFGRGNVSSVLIAGIQPADDIINICKKLIPMGVIPTIIPFKPLDSSQMSEHRPSDPEEVLSIAKNVNDILFVEDLSVSKQSGCTKCGGCSLESVFQLVHINIRKEVKS
ncbi:MAG: hypothetical protein FWC26_13590 [Fibromonadales bacterium]|nr:hypothetical protein [Fibromonadales bacterium]